MTKLFLEGWTLVPTPDHADEGAKTLTGIVLSQVEDDPAFHYGEKTKRLWYRGAAADVRKVAQRMHVVVDTMLERVDSELHDADLLLAFSAFDLGGDYSDARRVHWIRLLGNALDLPGDTLVGEFLKALPHAKYEHSNRKSEHMPGSQSVDNREIMARWLEPAHVDRYFPGETFRALPSCIRFYIAMEDGTANVERSLGGVAKALEKHSGPVDDSGSLVADALELKLDGPREESEIAVRIDPGGPLTLTDFGRECA